MSGFFTFSNFLKPPEPPDPRWSDEDVEMPGISTRSLRKRTQSESTSTSVSTSNSYATLQDGVQEPETPKAKKRKTPKDQKPAKASTSKPKSTPEKAPVKEKRPPPITVKKLNITQLNEKLCGVTIKKENISIKLTQFGIKVYVTNTTEFKLLKSFLQDSKIEFFTHQLKEEKMSKFVLYGLPNVEIEKIQNELVLRGFNPCDIKLFKIRRTRYEHHTNYLVYFKKSEGVKLSQLREIRSIFNVIISWSHYNNKGVTQCSNCQSFGHGSSNCHLSPTCLKCGDNHKTDACPLDKDKNKNGKIPDQKLCCANCLGRHTANYHKCPARERYLKVQNARKGATIKKYNPRFQPAPELNDMNFPFLNHKSAWKNKNPQNIESASTVGSFTDDNLFSPQECFAIFQEFISKLTRCKSRQDQLQVIGEITFKYIK
jgi:hypothetical protein